MFFDRMPSASLDGLNSSITHTLSDYYPTLSTPPTGDKQVVKECFIFNTKLSNFGKVVNNLMLLVFDRICEID
jgi:hypothetical protein